MASGGGRKLRHTTYMDSYGRQPWRDHTGNFWDGYVDGKPPSAGQVSPQERQRRTTRHFKVGFFVTVVILCIGGIAAAAIYRTHRPTTSTPTTLSTTPATAAPPPLRRRCTSTWVTAKVSSVWGTCKAASWQPTITSWRRKAHAASHQRVVQPGDHAS